MSTNTKTPGEKPTMADLGKERKLDYLSISAQLNFLQGKVLTVIDASYSEERQLKAVKDLIKSAFREQEAWVMQLCFPETQMWSTDQVRAMGEDPEKLAAEVDDHAIEVQ